ncbi:PREDICTED: secreted acidic protein 1A-like [Ipomoea nil]|uniref:secreted acidic protein 1A-like n=1 Tax=Ipomoea nil TaxID=35883 RepID=UPI0009012010|nr:PREDICTED: secreted acidic protein 1A-like [Ipomoea nil]XP_019196493.1 PREDICTED: secreted acidic protein 1A-like [Ipomoea nil]
MAFRGRGRGRGGFGGGFRIAKQESYELFPKINDQDLGNASTVTERVSLARWYLKLQNYWNSSPYYLGGESDTSKKTKSMDIERFSDRNSDTAKAKRPLSHFITVDPAYFPGELARGGTTGRRAAKRVRWNEDKDLQKLDLFEKLEQKSKGQDEKKTNEGEDDEEEEENIEEEEQEDDEDGDYMRPFDFDDDEDDFNIVDDNDDEGGTF